MWGDYYFSKEMILFTTLLSFTAKTAMKISGKMNISRSNRYTLCAERGVCTGLGEHMDPGGGGLELLYIRQGILASTPFVTFK